MRKLIRLTSNVKSQNGEPWTVTLEDVNILRGRSRKGKTAVVQALTLLQCGFADDLQGRDDVRALEMLISLGPRRGEIGDTVFVEGQCDDGTTARYQIERQDDGVVRVVQHNTADVWGNLSVEAFFPLRHVERVLLSEDATIRGQIVEWSVTGLSRRDVLNQMATGYHARYVELTGDIVKNETAVAELRRAAKIAASRATEARNQAKAANAIVNAGKARPQRPRPTEEEVVVATQAVATAQAAVEAAAVHVGSEAVIVANAISVEERKAQEDVIVNSIIALRAQEQHNADLLAQWNAYATTLPGPPDLQWYDESIEGLSGLLTFLRVAVRRGVEHSPFDNSFLGKEVFAAQVGVVEAGIQSLHDGKARAAATDPNAEARTNAQNTINGITVAIQKTQGEIATAERELVALPPAMNVTDAQQNLITARQDLQQAQETLKDINDRESTAKATAEARNTADAMERDADEWLALKRECHKVVKDLLPRCVSAFEAQVQRYLPKSMRFGVLVGEDTAVRVGLWKRGRGADGAVVDQRFLDISTSGAEWMAVCMAIAISITRDVRGPVWFTPVRERGISSDVHAQMVRALRIVQWGQVLTTTTERPKGSLSRINLIEVEEVFVKEDGALGEDDEGGSADGVPDAGAPSATPPVPVAAPPGVATTPPETTLPPETTPPVVSPSSEVPQGLVGVPPGAPTVAPPFPPPAPTPVALVPPTTNLPTHTSPPPPPSPPAQLPPAPPVTPIPAGIFTGPKVDPQSPLAGRLRDLGWAPEQVVQVDLAGGVRADVMKLTPEVYFQRYPAGATVQSAGVVPIAIIGE